MKLKNNEKVLLGMSGGVDSSVAAIILKEQGYEVIGATMRLCESEKISPDAVNDAKKVCERLGIEHCVLDLREQFKTCVIDNFIETYADAKTPNPCIECNKYLKFGAFYEKALELGCKYIATGHYAKIEFSEEYNQHVLKKADAEEKDQSYVLYNIPQEMVDKILLPLGRFKHKEEIRRLAEDYNLDIAKKKDSQEICFIPDNDYVSFLEKNMKDKQKPGDIVNTKGEVLGEHKGLIYYTIGQRKGLRNLK